MYSSFPTEKCKYWYTTFSFSGKKQMYTLSRPVCRASAQWLQTPSLTNDLNEKWANICSWCVRTTHPSARQSFMTLPSYGVFVYGPQDSSTEEEETVPITRLRGLSRLTLPMKTTSKKGLSSFIRHSNNKPPGHCCRTLPVHCFFTSFGLIGWTATKYFGSASRREI